jgi:CRP/FNR family transcriptional regulator, cyclic AMP receptor protein
METTYDLLAAQPFLNGLTPAQLDKLSCWSKKSMFHAGARLFEEGGRADRCWIIREGHVTLDTHLPGRPDAIVETLGPGAVLGWSWLFAPYRWHFDARALTQVRATAFDGACLRGKCNADPALGYALMSRFAQVLIERLQWTRLRLLDLYGDGNRS